MVPTTIAPSDLSTWVPGSDYAITNNPFTPLNAVPAMSINSLCYNGAKSAAVLPIGTTAADNLNLSSGFLAFQGGAANADLVITNGNLTSGTNELDVFTGYCHQCQYYDSTKRKILCGE